ncbi:hypothetical protein HDU78_009712 [Chytriomyces hyalinus]|nr:hypothetical protein HDU78_009712 [Chytriomyces hyalinus]KAJ3262814.1 hypothetical protein HDU77_011752 [Chytriomyces hyalinus]
MSTADVIPLSALFTASSTDNSSDACKSDKCAPWLVADRAVLATPEDSFWQSEIDPACTTQPWIKADWSNSGSYHLSTFQIEYGKDSADASFSGLQLASTAAGLVQTAQAYLCNITTTPTDKDPSKVERCVFDPSQNGGMVWDAVSAKFTFKFNGKKNNGCQLSVDEIQIRGIASASNSINPPGNAPNPVDRKGAMSAGGIAAIVISVALVVAGLAAWGVRQKNLRMRRLAQKVFLERRIAQNEYQRMEEEQRL